MAYTTNNLISDAYYASGIVSREFETVSGTQYSTGLQWVNDILAEKRVDDSMVPYEKTYTFNAIQGREVYFIPKLIKIDTIVFYLDQVRYSLNYTQRNQYFGSPRVENINSLPFEWYFERDTKGGNLYIYFSPDQNYPFEIKGVFDMEPLVQGQNLLANETVFDLGNFKQYSDSTIGVGQLIINDFDMQGYYPEVGSFINYVNSGIIPGVNARLDVNDVVLYSNTEPPVSIYVRTSGFPPNGTRFIQNVYATTTADLVATYNPSTVTLTAAAVGGLVVDGQAINILGTAILVVSQTDLTQNGLYQLTIVGDGVTQWELQRLSNYVQAKQIEQGDIFLTLNGTVNRANQFVQTADVSQVDVSPITFEILNAISFTNFSLLQRAAYAVVNSSGFDDFYITYLRYALAQRICTEYNANVPVNVTMQLSKYEAWIAKKSRILDLTMQKVSSLQTRPYINWGFVNLGHGWRP